MGSVTREERLAALLEQILASSMCCERAYRRERCEHHGCASNPQFIKAARAALDEDKVTA